MRVTRRGASRRAKGFTLIELLIVIAIIVIIGALLFPAFRKALQKSRQAACKSTLRQFGLALIQYRHDHDGRMPAWLSNLYSDDYVDYFSAKSEFICRSDNSRGVHGSKPDNVPDTVIGDQYPETDDTEFNLAVGTTNRNPEVPRCSYMYEYTGGVCGWWSGYLGSGGLAAEEHVDTDGNGTVTWNEAKEYQMTSGDRYQIHAYTDTTFPAVRCFNHWDEREILARNWDDDLNGPSDGGYDGTIKKDRMTLNVSYMGNVFEAPVKWEEKTK